MSTRSGGSTSRARKTDRKGTFICEKCNLSTPFHSFGRKCPFSSSLVFLEEAYVARDPFSSAPKPLLLGSHCTACGKAVCVSQSCSIFYTKRFCLDCARSNLEEFPTEIQQEILKESKKDEKNAVQ